MLAKSASMSSKYGVDSTTGNEKFHSSALPRHISNVTFMVFIPATHAITSAKIIKNDKNSAVHICMYF